MRGHWLLHTDDTKAPGAFLPKEAFGETVSLLHVPLKASACGALGLWSPRSRRAQHTVPLFLSARGNPGNLECRSRREDPVHPAGETKAVTRWSSGPPRLLWVRSPGRVWPRKRISLGWRGCCSIPVGPPAFLHPPALGLALNLQFLPLEGPGRVCSSKGYQGEQVTGSWVCVRVGCPQNPGPDSSSAWSLVPSSPVGPGARLTPSTARWDPVTSPLPMDPVSPSQGWASF